MSPAVCYSSSPSAFTGGSCLDSKHILILIVSLVLMILLIRISYYTEDVYYCCDPYTDLPTAEISARSISFLVLRHHIPALLMIIDISGSNRILVLCVALLLNAVILLERTNKLPSYRLQYSRCMIACSWLRLLSYLTTVLSLMTSTDFSEHAVLLLSGIIICTYATSRYIEVRENRLLS